MKRIASMIVVVLLLLACLPAGAAGKATLAPELVVSMYNDALETVFSALLDDADASTIALIKRFAKVEYLTSSDGTIMYANDNATVSFLFSADTRYSAPDNMFFYTDLTDKNVLKNLPQLAFAYAVSVLDDDCDLEEFLTWINDATDGDTFFSKSFYGTYSVTPNESSSILLLFF